MLKIGIFQLKKVYFDDTPIPRDDGCAETTGWTWIDDNSTTIEFCEEACATLSSGGVGDIAIEIMCSEQQIFIV